MTTLPMTTTRIGDTEIAWRFDGRADGPVVVLSHSLLSDHRMWDDAITALGDKYRLLRYDTRGHGGSGATEPPYSTSMLAEDVVGLLDALRLDTVHFMGLSMGGMIGQRLGAEHPTRVHSLVLANTTGAAGPKAVWDERLAQARHHGLGALVEPTLQRWFTAPYLARKPVVIETIRAAMLATSLDGYVGCGSAVRDLDHAALLGRIAAPTLVISGEHDAGTTPDAGRALAAAIPHARFELIRDASHLSAVEQPQVFYGLVRSFLDGL